MVSQLQPRRAASSGETSFPHKCISLEFQGSLFPEHQGEGIEPGAGQSGDAHSGGRTDPGGPMQAELESPIPGMCHSQ